MKLCTVSFSCDTSQGRHASLEMMSGSNWQHVTMALVAQPDKLERAQAAYKYFVEGDRGALKDFPGGSEPGS